MGPARAALCDAEDREERHKEMIKNLREEISQSARDAVLLNMRSELLFQRYPDPQLWL